jgi:aryl-alcohol dehydrogenase-like predicted oxidoreductase
MKYTQLGGSGLAVSRICLGCMTYGTPNWRPWVLDEIDARPFYRRALELGINFFDTADMYSMGVSEEVAGHALREMANMEEIVLATKVHFPMGDGPNMGGISRKHIVQACEASLRRLGVETIDLYQIHRFKSTVPIEETRVGAVHFNAESLQPPLLRGRARDDSAVHRGRSRRHTVVAARARPSRAHYSVAGIRYDSRGHRHLRRRSL